MSTMIASILVLYSSRYKVHKFDKITPSLAIRWARTEKRSSVETDAKSTGSSFCRKDRVNLQNEDPRLNALSDANWCEFNGVFVL